MSWLKSFVAEENGATAIEYALFAGMISLVLVGVFGTLGGRLFDFYTLLGQQISQ